MSNPEIGAAALDATVVVTEDPILAAARRAAKAQAAVPYHERATAAAREAVTRLADKKAKFQERLAGIDDEIAEAQAQSERAAAELQAARAAAGGD